VAETVSSYTKLYNFIMDVKFDFGRTLVENYAKSNPHFYLRLSRKKL